MTPADRISNAVYAEQVATMYRQMPIAFGVNIVNAALTAIVLTPVAARPLPAAWFSVVLLVSIGRWALWWRHHRNQGLFDARRWSLLATCGSLCAGLSWGIGGVLMFPVVPQLAQLFLVVVVAGMCTGAAVLSASHLPTLFAFLLAASFPISARFIARVIVGGSAANGALGAMILVFAAALVLSAKHFNATFAETMRLRFELHEANLRLQAEMAEHRATAAALHQAQKLEAIGQLTGGIAHDFNNLLTVVIGNLALARSRASYDSAITPLIEGAVQAAERGVALIQRLLGFARRQHLEPRSIDLARLVAGIEGLLLRTLGPGINLVIAADPDLAPVLIDANQLELAILNLTINARDAMPEGGVVRIGLAYRRADSSSLPQPTPAGYVVLSVADTGKGMDEATLARAFDPFFTTKQTGSGSGLGLPTVQGFVAQSGGAVQIRSQPGAGTTVELWLPKAGDRPPEADERDRDDPDMPQGAANILLCDDDDDVRRLISEYLVCAGYTVIEANGAETALPIVEGQGEIDLLVVDYAMPGMNGIEVLRRSRQRRPNLKALLVTGYAGAVQDGAVAEVAILRKPFALTELTRKVAELLAAQPPEPHGL